MSKLTAESDHMFTEDMAMLAYCLSEGAENPPTASNAKLVTSTWPIVSVAI